MKISLDEVGKKFNRDWIFRKISFELSAPSLCAITGHNGSGKSTLLQCIAGSIHLSEGNVTLEIQKEKIEPENRFNYISIAAPYLELIEEMTALELLNYHQKFKSFKAGWTSELVLDKIGLSKAAHKQIRYFSSGMKQRLKLAQAFFSTTPLLLLDEPCTNLDQAGIDLYLWLLQNLSTDRIIIISSNDPIEYPQNSHTIHLGV
ncbi:MAG: hypothetical protein RL131_372 [Bacteroidota bacterium]|jgi:ABC-type multidrug transport system ATPase subunit